jgi:hypothetical protein
MSSSSSSAASQRTAVVLCKVLTVPTDSLVPFYEYYLVDQQLYNEELARNIIGYKWAKSNAFLAIPNSEDDSKIRSFADYNVVGLHDIKIRKDMIELPEQQQQ